jgi:hypothetical protein
MFWKKMAPDADRLAEPVADASPLWKRRWVRSGAVGLLILTLAIFGARAQAAKSDAEAHAKKLTAEMAGLRVEVASARGRVIDVEGDLATAKRRLDACRQMLREFSPVLEGIGDVMKAQTGSVFDRLEATQGFSDDLDAWREEMAKWLDTCAEMD